MDEALHSVIASRDEPPLAELLLRLGAGANSRDSRGWTSLHLAAAYGYAASVRRLLQAGADPSVRTPAGLTPADVAARNGYDELAEALRCGEGIADDHR